jgi:L-fucose isomerase-like protein
MEIKTKEDNERRERESLNKKLKEMESKILVGGVDQIDKNQVLEQQLRLQAQELEQKAVT